VEIETTGGKVFERRIDIPKGDPRDPMTPEELAIKFDALASPSFTDARRAAIREAVFGLEKMETVGELMALCVADRSGA